MSQAKLARPQKRQLGQFLTPGGLAERLVRDLLLGSTSKVLEPSMGDGSFLLPLIERFMSIHEGSQSERFARTMKENVYGVELDPEIYTRCVEKLRNRWGELPEGHNLILGDFFRQDFALPTYRLSPTGPEHLSFDHIVGNPPFGGTIAVDIQDELDRKYGVRKGRKIKKETYSFFIVKSLDLLAPKGRLRFICSDSLLTINTMRGLRALLMEEGLVQLTSLSEFSGETSYGMLVLDVARAEKSGTVVLDGRTLAREAILATPNLSWRVSDETRAYFEGPLLGSLVVATSGMTIGRNEWFLKEIREGSIEEWYEYEFREEPVTVERERTLARLGKIPSRRLLELRRLESTGRTERTVHAIRRSAPRSVHLPHSDYRYYNKACCCPVYAAPTTAVYWRNDGESVLTFKKTGPWYLRGVGGQAYFGREGLTWALVASRLWARYLPRGYVLDSGSPCAFLKDGVPREELYLVLAWSLSNTCNRLLKEVLNHTQNIQSKDFERLPYPSWVSTGDRHRIAGAMMGLVERARGGERVDLGHPELRSLVEEFDRSRPTWPTGGSRGPDS